jgi:hypothetical protein
VAARLSGGDAAQVRRRRSCSALVGFAGLVPVKCGTRGLVYSWPQVGSPRCSLLMGAHTAECKRDTCWYMEKYWQLQFYSTSVEFSYEQGYGSNRCTRDSILDIC